MNKSKHFYGGILYDGKIDNYHYIGHTPRVKHIEPMALYTGEVYGHTIAKSTIDTIIESELEVLLK